MKNFLLLILSVIILSCQGNSKSEAGQEQNTESDSGSTPASHAELVTHQIKDNQGQVMSVMTFPSDWQIHTKGKVMISGPNDVRVYSLPNRNFAFTTDPAYQRIYAQSGMAMREFTSAREVVMQDLLPIAKKDGSKLVRIEEAPEIVEADQALSAMMYTIGPRDNRYDAVVSEWEDKDGNPYAIIVHVSGMGGGGMMTWMYSGQILDAPKQAYANARQTLVNGLASLKYNPRYFDKYNQNEMNRESASWAAHNQRMASQQRAFDAQQQAYRERTDAINNSISATYESQNAASDRSHNRFLNYIKDESTVVNPSDGKRYQVQGGANQYWMNGDGQYVGSNDPNYDPNRNQGSVQHTWNEAEIRD